GMGRIGYALAKRCKAWDMTILYHDVYRSEKSEQDLGARQVDLDTLLRESDFVFFFSSRRRHTRSDRDWSSDVCSSDLECGSALMPVRSLIRPARARLLSAFTACQSLWKSMSRASGSSLPSSSSRFAIHRSPMCREMSTLDRKSVV